MIQANELRIGNWVMGNKPYQVGINQLSTHANYLRQGKEGYFEPIPLTEDILIKAGFKQHTSGAIDFYIDDDGYTYWNICYGTDNQWWFHAGFGNGDFPIANPNYVHQLQNLYYALTNKELKINL